MDCEKSLKNCQTIKTNVHLGGPSEEPRKILETSSSRGSSHQKHVNILSPGHYHIFIKYGPKRGAAAFGRRPQPYFHKHTVNKLSLNKNTCFYTFESPEDDVSRISRGSPQLSNLGYVVHLCSFSRIHRSQHFDNFPRHAGNTVCAG